MKRVNMLVLGAGPTGVGAAWRLDEAGHASWRVIDAGRCPGGMAASIRDDAGFLWDMGGHVIHSHFSYFDQVTKNAVAEWNYPRRNGCVWIRNRFVPAPVQHHVDKLGLELDPPRAAGNAPHLGAWFEDQFGKQLTATFFEPFNFKMWAHPASMLSHSWTSLRSGSNGCNVPALRHGSATAANMEHSVSVFPYPRNGSGSMWLDICNRLPADHFTYDRSVVALDLDRRIATLSDRQVIGFDRCITSMPLTLTGRIAVNQPNLHALTRRLRASSTLAIGFGFNGDIPDTLRERSWVYTADDDIPFHRATILSNYSDRVAGDGRWSVLNEVATSSFRPVDPESVATRCLEVFRKWGVEAEPVSTWQRLLPLGYPVPTLDRDEILVQVQPELERFGVKSRGRFGGWRYESSNQDYAFMQGVEAVDAFLTRNEEQVYWHPERF